jgi:SAM-dependent methyltransferase
VSKSTNSNDWHHYLATYHDDHPGVTERLLLRCSRHGRSHYDDIADAIQDSLVDTSDPIIIDLGCGSAPLASILAENLPTAQWFGLDQSLGELAWASQRHPGTVIRADMECLPFRNESADALVSTCAIMLAQPLGAVLTDAARVLRPGGTFIVSAPWPSKFRFADLAPLARLAGGLGSTLRNPNDRALASWRQGTHLNGGLVVSGVTDDYWSVPLRTRADVDDLMESLYLHGLSQNRVDRAHRWLTRWAGSRRRFPIAIRTWRLTRTVL